MKNSGLKDSIAILKALDKKDPTHGFKISGFENDSYSLDAHAITVRNTDDSKMDAIDTDMMIIPMGEKTVFLVGLHDGKTGCLNLDIVEAYTEICNLEVLPKEMGVVALAFYGDTNWYTGDDVWNCIKAQMDVFFECIELFKP